MLFMWFEHLSWTYEYTYKCWDWEEAPEISKQTLWIWTKSIGPKAIKHFSARHMCLPASYKTQKTIITDRIIRFLKLYPLCSCTVHTSRLICLSLSERFHVAASSQIYYLYPCSSSLCDRVAWTKWSLRQCEFQSYAPLSTTPGIICPSYVALNNHCEGNTSWSMPHNILRNSFSLSITTHLQREVPRRSS